MATPVSRWLIRGAALALAAGAMGCLPTRGTPVFVDSGAGNFWSGKGVLVEVSPDQTQCRVVVRDGSFLRRDRWMSCNNVHPRRG